MNDKVRINDNTNLKFEIPFEAKTYLNQVELTVPYIYAHIIRKVNISLIVGLLLLITGLLIFPNNEDLGILLIFISLIVLFNAYQKNKLYKRSKNAFMDVMQKNMFEKADGLKTGTFEFLPDKLRYTDDLTSSSISWTDFEGYKVVKSNLLMIVNQKKGNILIIGEKEIGTNNFKKVISFVEQRFK